MPRTPTGSAYRPARRRIDMQARWRIDMRWVEQILRSSSGTRDEIAKTP